MVQIRFWILVILVTCLIWIAADQGVTKTYVISTPLTVKAREGRKMLVRPADANLRSIDLTFSGPNHSISQLKTVEDSLTTQLALGDREPGSYTLDLAKELQTQMEQFPPGLTIVSVHPPSLHVDVDRFVERQIPLRLDKGEVVLEGEPQLNPTAVKAVVPEKGFDSLPDAQKVIVLSGATVLKGVKEGESVSKPVSVPRETAGIKFQSVEPSEVTLMATVKVRTTEGRLPTVPIRLLIGNDVIKRFQITFGLTDDPIATCEIMIRGPVDIVHDLIEKASKYGVRGYVEITMEDAERGLSGALMKVPQILNLPKDVELAKTPEPIEIHIIERPREPTSH